VATYQSQHPRRVCLEDDKNTKSILQLLKSGAWLSLQPKERCNQALTSADFLTLKLDYKLVMFCGWLLGN